MRLTALVPATSANLGPGFDSFGLALDLCNEVTVEPDAEPGVAWEGEGASELPTDGSDAVSRALAELGRRLDRPVPAMRISGRNRIPLERGLGSSAAAVVAGVALGDRLLGLGLDRTTMLELAAAIEGHADNAAAALFGGFTVVLPGRVVARFDPSPELRPALFVPEGRRVSTPQARRVLPAQVPFDDAAANAGHAALTAVALLHEPDLLPAAMRDRLHEDARLRLAPEARALAERLREAGLAVCVSGSGPTLLAFEREDVLTPEPGEGWALLRVPVRTGGVEVLGS